MQEYYDYYGNDQGNNKPPKRNVGTIVLAVILSVLVGLLIGILAMPRLFDVSGEALENWAPPWWQKDGGDSGTTRPPQDGGNLFAPVEPAATPMISATPRPEREVPSLGSGGADNAIGEVYNPVVEIADKVSPSVVGIITTAVWNNEGETPMEVDVGVSSGIVLTEDGYIVTNDHVVADCDAVYVEIENGERMKAEIIGCDSRNEVAVIKIEKTGMHPIELGRSSQVRVGELAVAIGNPMGHHLVGGTVTVGYISAVNRVINLGSENMFFIQTDAAINPGNSGGALVNAKGQLIGINSAKSYNAGYDEYGNTIIAEGIGFAIPIDYAMPVIEQLIRYGVPARPGIGITGSTITTQSAKEQKVPQGARVDVVNPGGPADQAGLQEGDIITGVDGEVLLQGIQELVARVKTMKVGAIMQLDVWREGQTLRIGVQIVDLDKG